MKLARLIVVCAAAIMLAVSGSMAWGSADMAPAPINALSSPVPTPRPGGRWICVAKVNSNIRSGPSTRYRIVGLLRRGYRMNVIRFGYGWVYGRTATRTGWVYRPLLRCWDPLTNAVMPE